MEHKEYAYKMFNRNLTCTLGSGTFQYEPGVWYEETDQEANCRSNGFHVAKNPLDCLSYYHCFEDSQCWVVEIAGDMDEDGIDTKVSAQKIRLVKRLDLPEFVARACMYIMDHPELEYNCHVMQEKAETNKNHFAIAVGEDPKAKGKIGDTLGILRTYPDAKEIAEATCFEIDGEEYLPNIWYDASGTPVSVAGRIRDMQRQRNAKYKEAADDQEE